MLRAAYELLEVDQRADGSIRNHPLPVADLIPKRSWSAKSLASSIRAARRRGDIEPGDSESITLSESGFGEAARITRNHRLWEVYLVTHADIAPSHVDRDADMVEHVLEADLVRRLEATLRADNTWVPIPDSPHQI